MDKGKNPFSPGAGTPPPELAGRESLLEDICVALERIKAGRPEKSMFIVGLRGVGKTVLLVEIKSLAIEKGYKVAYVEAHESKQKKSLPELLAPELRAILYELDRGEKIAAKARHALGVLKSFINGLKLKCSGIEIGYDAEIGVADSGMLETDLPKLFLAVGEAAKEKETGVAIIIDELQYLEEEELSALIMSAHKVAQEALPVIVIGAGLPQLVGKAGNSKSYAERLFSYPVLDKLEKDDAISALQKPVQELGVEFTQEALDEIVQATKGYPYFLQEWGKHSWNIAEKSPITAEDVKKATTIAIQNLDRDFFKVRFDRLTPSEKKYVRALAELGANPQRSGDIADMLNVKVNSVAPIRSQLIKKGMIYSPAHGDTAFTVPLFEEFLIRMIPNYSAVDEN